MSDNKRAWWDNSNAYRLGYRPMDRSEDYADEGSGGGQGADRRPASRPQPGRAVLRRGSHLIPRFQRVRLPFTPVIHTRRSCLPIGAALANIGTEVVIRGRFASGHTAAGGVRGLVTIKRHVRSFFFAIVMPFIGPAFFAPGDGFFRRPLSYLLLTAAPALGRRFAFRALPARSRRGTPPATQHLDAAPASHAKMTG